MKKKLTRRQEHELRLFDKLRPPHAHGGNVSKRGYGRPKLRWSPITESERHEAAIRRNGGIV